MDNTVPVNIKITRKQQFATIGTQQTPFISLDLTVITLSSTIYGLILETKKHQLRQCIQYIMRSDRTMLRVP